MNRLNLTESAVFLYCRFSLFLKDPFFQIIHYKKNNLGTNFTPASNFGYLATPRQFFMGAKLFIGTPRMRNKGVLKKMVWNMV